jgi:hypothetical protein
VEHGMAAGRVTAHLHRGPHIVRPQRARRELQPHLLQHHRVVVAHDPRLLVAQHSRRSTPAPPQMPSPAVRPPPQTGRVPPPVMHSRNGTPMPRLAGVPEPAIRRRGRVPRHRSPSVPKKRTGSCSTHPPICASRSNRRPACNRIADCALPHRGRRADRRRRGRDRRPDSLA